ncbi:MAG TPA: efflux RND transporter periplasmic adaptor subunit [Candidatus Tumulicola sp.]
MRSASFDGMDVLHAKKRRVPRGVIAAIGVAVLIVATAGSWYLLARTGGGVTVDRSSVVTDAARRGDLDRSISAAGTLAPQDVHIVAALQAGVVESVFVKPGSSVATGTPIARLSNPDLDADVMSAQASVEVARADLISAQQQARASALAQRSAYSSARAQSEMDESVESSETALHRDGYIADQTYRIAQIKAGQSHDQMGLADAQIDVDSANQDAKIAAAKAQFAQASAQLTAKRAEVEALTVRARSSGLVQSVAVDPGARVDAGAELARVADQKDLKAVLQVPEEQAHAVAIGMPARVAFGDETAQGRVARIAPSAQDGSVAVDVAFARALSAGARPDENVDGTIELQTLRNVVSIARPAGAADNASVTLYRLDGSSRAKLTHVTLGTGSADRIQVISGLNAGDVVIVSDMSAYGGTSSVRLH